jgi:hypothetical protein
MNVTSPLATSSWNLRFKAWLNRPLSNWWCALGWIAASVLFLLLTRVLDGPSQADSVESIFSTWSIAHGHMLCAYPPGHANGNRFIAPLLYPLIAAGVSALARIGHSVPFPSQAQLGVHCGHAIPTMIRWSLDSHALTPTIRVGFVAWFIFLAGVVVLLRAIGRGRCGWEVATVVLMASAPPIFMCYEEVFHPEALIAMALILAGLACVRRGWWIGAGILVGLAVTSQQYALLVLGPLLILAPGVQRIKYALAAAASMAAVIVPMIALTAGGALHAAFYGSSLVTIGANNISATGGTVIWETHLQGAPLFLIVRILPVVLSMVVAWWGRRYFGAATLDAVPLLTIIGCSLLLRLVFEENIFGYYFMAAATIIVLLDILRGHVRGVTVAWVGLVTLVFDPVPWGHQTLHQAIPLVIGVIGALVFITDVVRKRVRWYVATWLVVIVLTCEPFVWGLAVGQQVLPNSVWQVVLVVIAYCLILEPLSTAPWISRVLSVFQKAESLELSGQ